MSRGESVVVRENLLPGGGNMRNWSKSVSSQVPIMRKHANLRNHLYDAVDSSCKKTSFGSLFAN